MDDSLFVMQRYWGSDESDADDSAEKSQGVLKKAKKHIALGDNEDKSNKKGKKVKLCEDSTIVNGEQNGLDEDLSEIETIPTTKKKFRTEKLSVSVQSVEFKRKKISVIDLDSENDVVNASPRKSWSPPEVDLSDSDKNPTKNLNASARESSVESEIEVLKSNLKSKRKKISHPPQNNALENDVGDKLNHIEVEETSLSTETQSTTDKDAKKRHSEETTSSQKYTVLGEVKLKTQEKVKRALPEWLANPSIIRVNLSDEKQHISELPYLDSNTKSNLTTEGFTYLFPVQQAVIPWLMQCDSRRLSVRPSDLCVSAPTGSGKTLAFVLPIVQSLKKRVVVRVRALVVLPVGDLALQVFKVFEKYCKGTDLRAVLITGHKSFQLEQSALVKSGIRGSQCLADIVITTPGRILDHVHKTPGFSLQYLRYLVIDEADRMMDEIQRGWLKQVEQAVFGEDSNASCCSQTFLRTPDFPSSACSFGRVSEPLQKLLYSATLSQDPESLHNLALYRPKLFTAKTVGVCSTPTGLQEMCVICDNPTKPMIIVHLIKKHNFKRVLCFVDKVERAHRLHLILAEMGQLQVREMSSLSNPVQRKIVLNQFAAGKVDVLVCSDIAMRGIDIADVDCSLSYDVPQQSKAYVHRAGRTARAGRSGTAITLLSKPQVAKFKRTLWTAGKQIPATILVDSSELEPYVESYQAALAAANATIDKEKRKNYMQTSAVKNKPSASANVVLLKYVTNI